jgi:hypothetical protein
MSPPLPVQFELAYKRNVLFALELLDAVTLTRISQGVKEVKAVGLKGTSILNHSGYFVWLQEDITPLEKITLDLGALPYESLEIPRADVTLPLTTVELKPRGDYPFATGITGLRGTLIESRVVSPATPEPVVDAEVRLQWLDDDNVTWRDAPIVSKTNLKGDFVSILRLTPNDVPDIDTERKFTVRVRMRRDTTERTSADLKLPQGRVADPSTISALTFAWDEL